MRRTPYLVSLPASFRGREIAGGAGACNGVREAASPIRLRLEVGRASKERSMNPGYQPRTITTIVIAISLGIALAACGSPAVSPGGSSANAAPSARATASPAGSAASGTGSSAGAGGGSSSAYPSMSPANALSAFKKIMGSAFRGNASLTGEMTVGSATFPITGTSAFSGPDNHATMTIAITGAPRRSETLSVGGVSYIKQGGHWFQKPAPAAGSRAASSLSQVLQSALDVSDVGIEVRNGQALHHLKPRGNAAIPISAIGVNDPGGDGTMAFEFYVRDDGTPVVMAITAAWTDVNGSVRQPVTMHIDYTFSSVGGQIDIAPPLAVWATFTSKRFGYTVAYPSDWDTYPSRGKKKPDALESAELTGMYVYRYPTDGATLNSATSGYVIELKRTKAKVTSNKPTKIAGLRARRLEWTQVYQGTREWNIEAIVVRGKYVYFFEYGSLAKTTDADRTLFNDLISSVTFRAK